jgi:hypothetical protein
MTILTVAKCQCCGETLPVAEIYEISGECRECRAINDFLDVRAAEQRDDEIAALDRAYAGVDRFEDCAAW